MNKFSDAFISYGRADSKVFATKLHDRLLEHGFKVWFDQNDIPLGVDFQNQIDDGIEKAHHFLFIIAPHSMNSPYCRKEIELALKRNKRIIPLLHVEQISRETWQQRNPQGIDAEWEAYKTKGLHSSFPNMHPEIGKINWIYFREGIDDFDKSLAGLLQLLERHKTYVHQHTSFLAKALEWERHQQQSRYLLVGEERSSAQAWLKVHFRDEQPPCTPTDLHCEYITESIKSAHNLMTQVFLAYAHQDKAVMEKIRNSLRREGFTVWTNTTDIQTGEAFEKAIGRGIEQADNVVYLLSPDALNSEYCQQELNYALSLNKRIIPVQVRETNAQQLPSVLRSLQYIDLTDNVKEEDYRLDENQLIKILHQDEAYYHQYKVLLVKALNWQRQNNNPSILLRGYNLRQSEAWWKTARHRQQHPPTSLQQEFITTSLQQPPASSLDVFISYCREDSDLAHKLNDALQMQGKTTWFDQESIPADVGVQQEIYQGIEACDNILFILSPHAVNSPNFRNEVEHAASLNKRFVTVLHREVNSAELHPELGKVQWIDFSQNEIDFATNFSQLVRTLDTDREHVSNHTKWSQRALEWEDKGRDDDLLLRGNEFAVAQAWLQTALEENKQPAPTALQQTLIEKSHQAIIAAEEAEKQRQAELLRLQEEKTKEAEARLAEQKKSARRQKMFLGAVSVLFAVAAVLAIIAKNKEYQAKQATAAAIQSEHQAKQATTEALAKSSAALFADNKKLDALREALRAKRTLQEIKGANEDLKQSVDGALQQAVFGVRQKNRLTGHKAPVLTVAVSHDGKMIASGSEDNTVKLWSADGKLLNTLPQHQGSVNDIAFSPDGQLIASASVDKTLNLWRRDGTLLHTLQGHKASVEAVAFSPDGKLLASASDDKTVKLWNRDGSLFTTLTEHTGEVEAVAFSPDGKLLASASDDKTVKLWNRDGSLFTTLTGHKAEVEAVAFSPDGKQIISAGRDEDEKLKLWNLDGSLEQEFLAFGDVEAVAFSPDGQTIASVSSDKTITLWNLDGSLKDMMWGHSDKVTDVAFSSDRQTIASASEDNTVNLWVMNHSSLKTLSNNFDGTITAVTFSPDGKLIASTSSNNKVNLWRRDGTLFKTLEKHSSKVTAVAFSPDGKLIVSASDDKTLNLWNLEGKLLKTLIGHTDKVKAVAFSPDGKWIASASEDKNVNLWNLEGKLLNTLTGHKDAVKSVTFSRDSKLIVSGGRDKTVKLWNLEGNLLANLTAHKGPVTDVSFSADGQVLATASVDNIVKLWNLNGIKLTFVQTLEHPESVNEVVFSPDGQMLASATVDNTIKLWNRQGKLLTTLYAHNDAVNSVAFSQDGKTLASASEDTQVILWPVERVLKTEDLQAEGCTWLGDYLKHSSEVEQSNRSICNYKRTQK